MGKHTFWMASFLCLAKSLVLRITKDYFPSKLFNA